MQYYLQNESEIQEREIRTIPALKTCFCSFVSRKNRSFARSFVRLAVILSEHLNCLLDLYNARANLDFLHRFFVANFNPMKTSKNATNKHLIS